MPRRSSRASAWEGWQPPAPKPADPDDDEAAELPVSPADKPEPAPWTYLEPLFPPGGVPFTPESPCPHHCKFCSGAGSFVDYSTGEAFDCPDCGGTGHGKIPDGSAFVCMVCHQAGKDGHPALPLDVAPLPKGPPIPKRPEDPKRKQASLEAVAEYIARELEKLGAKETPHGVCA